MLTHAVKYHGDNAKIKASTNRSTFDFERIYPKIFSFIVVILTKPHVPFQTVLRHGCP